MREYSGTSSTAIIASAKEMVMVIVFFFPSLLEIPQLQNCDFILSSDTSEREMDIQSDFIIASEEETRRFVICEIKGSNFRLKYTLGLIVSEK